MPVNAGLLCIMTYIRLGFRVLILQEQWPLPAIIMQGCIHQTLRTVVRVESHPQTHTLPRTLGWQG